MNFMRPFIHAYDLTQQCILIFSDAESGRSGELIQNGRSKPGAIPPDALYTTKRDAVNNSSPDNRPLYENVKVSILRV